MLDKKLPIVITAFNRPKHLARTLCALRKCEGSEDSELYIFIDGANPGNENKVLETIAVAEECDGFKLVRVKMHSQNLGLAKNVISSVTSVMKQNEGAIVLEDDMLVNQYFIEYMNKAFTYYRNDLHIGCITGYSPDIPTPFECKEDVFLSTRSSTWGWSMTSEDWLSINWDRDVYKKLYDSPEFIEKLSLAGKDRINILRNYIEGKWNVWGIRRGSWQITNNKLTVYPKKSLLKNIGFDGTGVHCSNLDDDVKNFDEHFSPEVFSKLKVKTVNNATEKLIKAYYEGNL